MRPSPFFRFPLLPALLAACLAMPVAPPPAFGNSYKRGDASCSDFQLAEKNYQKNPTGGYAVSYARCLIARGGEDVKAQSILSAEIRKGRVDAARDQAVYIATGGTMVQNKLDDRNYNEALKAYEKVIFLINGKPDYPKGFVITEKSEQHELEAYYYVVLISYLKAKKGMVGIHHSHLLQSPTYEGKKDIKLYSTYSPYTLDSLERTIERTNICLNLPQKNYHRPLLYHQTIAYCRMMRRISQELLVLERKRLTLLNGKACAGDITKCSEYQEVVFKQIVPLFEKKNVEDNKIWDAKSLAGIPDYE